jgi:hypothetical protein
MSTCFALFKLIRIILDVFGDVLTSFCVRLRSPAALAAENLFLRKQLGLYVERKKKPRRATDAVRFTMAHLYRFFDWHECACGLSGLFTIAHKPFLRPSLPTLSVSLRPEELRSPSSKTCATSCSITARNVWPVFS